MTQLIKIENLSKTYKGENLVLSGVDLTLDQGVDLGLIGESGCGKSTLANIIMGFDTNYQGKVTVFDKDLKETLKKSKKDYYARVQLIFQNPFRSMNGRMLIGDYLKEPIKNYRIAHQGSMDQEVTRWLEFLNLPGTYKDKLPYELSGGELQRVSIARALIVKPQIIIFDEITSGLDVVIQNRILNLVKDMQKEFKFTGIYISHDFSVIKRMCQSVAVIHKGKIVEKLAIKNLEEDLKTDYGKQLWTAALTLKTDFA